VVVSATPADRCNLGHLTIDALSDDILLCIFDSYQQESEEDDGAWPWHVLVHICRRWRRVIFAFPAQLNLQPVCKSRRDVKSAMDIWPALPIRIRADLDRSVRADEDDILDVLEYRDRIAGIHLSCQTLSQTEKCVTWMQGSFPILTSLHLTTPPPTTFVVTNAFLGGSAPRLQRINLTGIYLPNLSNFLLSASDLVNLSLGDLPITGAGYISPEEMGACLSMLKRLQSLEITLTLGPPSFYPTSQRSSPLTPTALPALTMLSLKGPYEGLEALVAQIDAPLLNSGHLEFWGGPMSNMMRVPHFIHSTERFKFPNQVEVDFRYGAVTLYLDPLNSPTYFSLTSPCSTLSLQVILIEQIFERCPPLLSHVEQLELKGDSVWARYFATSWLGFLRPFIAVQTLCLSGEDLVPRVAHTLGNLKGKSATEVLPALHTILLWSFPSNECEVSRETARLLEPFIAAREHFKHPVVVLCEDLLGRKPFLDN
jgi:hypothetical protein